MASTKINRRSKANPDTGFGSQTTAVGGRFVNKDGSINVRKQGLSFMRRTSFYSSLLEAPWPKFLLLIFVAYLLANFLFTLVYLLVGMEHLQGFHSATQAGKVREVFYFSTQTFTTVGYGRINPVGDAADIVASIETMMGWLFFALVTGLLYGRFTRPKAYINFSQQALVSPYQAGVGVMFRMVPYKSLHQLTDVRVVVSLSLKVTENEKSEYRFYTLSLERSRIDMFNMNWTVVHPVSEESPLLHFTKEDLDQSDAEMYVQVTGFDPIFSNTVMSRTSYTYKEFIWGAKFKPMYHESEDGSTTILELDKLNEFDRVQLPVLAEINAQ
ncbi:ion channel [Flavisolibacter ginsenosidimutans]|uniref:Transporter n=1 Tax=Flavisolibacter ginsenosidimutans TaxID=661481 RepID=A0A5B8UM36_9BACT|nr:ion channel [Flavisolibacter ginsenosidimutans]QEC57727.1 transporter [Flavisolibacter ginsenosidimutans]